MNAKILISLLLIFSASLLLNRNLSAQSYIVIVHEDNPVDALSKGEISKILLKKKSKWDHGVEAMPIDLDSKSKTRNIFSKDILF